jgi:hypothetical protein
MRFVAWRFSLPLAFVAVIFPAAAKAATYQVTVEPQLIANFFGPGEPADDFSSSFQNINGTGVNAPPQFSQAVLTFTTPDINSDIGVSTPDASADIPEINPLSNIALGDNLVASPEWRVFEALWIPGDIANPAINDELFFELDNGTPGADQQWQFDLFFPPNTLGQGTAISGTIFYFDYATVPGENNFDEFTFQSAAATEVPEPASLATLSVLSLALLKRGRRAA